MMEEDKDFIEDHGHDHAHNHHNCQGHDHSHSHSHSHSQKHYSNGHDECHNHQHEYHYEDDESCEEDHDHSHQNGHSFSIEDLMNVIQFGANVHMVHIIEQSHELIHQRDTKGNTCAHWACKRGDLEILHSLSNLGCKFDISSLAEPNMLPFHWAAADGKIDSIEFLLSKGHDINGQDSNGSSPAVIAAQYNQIDTIIYLYKHGADLTLCDSNGDHCLHWAAYKGHDELLQLLLYLNPREINTADRYGQAPLHLAAMRGHNEVVRTLLTKYSADFNLRDKSNKTPLELAIEKKQGMVEWSIRKLTTSNAFELYRKALLEDWRFLGVAFVGSTDVERSVWMWRLTMLSNLYASICMIQFTLDSQLSDLYFLHYYNTTLLVIWWILFLGCLWKEPGYISGKLYATQQQQQSSSPPSSSKKYFNITSGGRNNNGHNDDIEECRHSLLDNEDNLYEKGLNIIARLETSSYEPNLCHSCHVERPLRSKHDRFSNKCVYKFDHYCPFVFNAVGRDNYKFFVGLLILHPIAYIGFVIVNIYYYIRTTHSIAWIYYLFFIYSVAMCLMVMTLASYHLSLIRRNLTTNEDANKLKYSYLQDEYLTFHNPFNMNKTCWSRIMEAICPTQNLYYTRIDAIRGEIRSESQSDEA